MKQQLAAIPTMIEVQNLAQLEEFKITYNEVKNTDYVVLRNEQGNILAYFHDANKKPTIEETVEWMQETDNLTFPGNVSIMQGIKDRYDVKFHSELDVVVPKVMDAYIERMDMMGRLAQDPEFMELVHGLVARLPAEPARTTVRIK
jgi:hypothetical protein